MISKFIKLKNFYILGTFIALSSSHYVLGDSSPEKILLSDAIKVYSSLTPEDSLKERINKKEIFLNKIDLIIDKYSDTEIGLELLTRNSYKNFDIVKIRKDYLDSLTKYNLSTCELDPSYKCLGFVSLSQANKFCSNSNELPKLVLAAKSLNNSYDIFSSQKDSKVFIPAVFSSFRQCVDSASNQFSKDFIKSYFIQTLLKNNQNSKAIGITEGMKTDMFRIHSAAEIRDYQGKFDTNTYLTLIKRASKLSDDDREISSLFLSNKLLKNNSHPFDQRIFKYLPKEFKSKTILCGDKHSYYSEIGLDFIFLSNKYVNSRGARKINRDLILSDLNQGINKCNNFNTTPINYFIRKGDIEVASKIREFQSKNGINPKDGINFFDRILTNVEITNYFIGQNQLFEDFLLQNRGLKIKELKKVEKNFMYPYVELAGDFSIFKSFVDMNDTCNASSILFQRLVNTNYEAPAVLYYISNPLMSKEKDYSCGDAELQLLIN